MSTSESSSAQIDLFASPEEILGRQQELLRSMLLRVESRHPFYREYFSKHNFDPSRVWTFEDFEALPVVGKDDFNRSPKQFRLESEGDDSDSIWDVVYTSGSTAAPTPIYQSSHDFLGILLAQKRMAEIRGMTRRDRVANLYPLTTQPHGAWTRANNAAAAIGCYVACGLSGSQSPSFDVTRRLKEVTELVVELDPTILWGVPSYVRRVLSEISEMGGRLPSVRMLAVSGEECSPAMADSLREAAENLSLGGVVVSNSLGASELQCGLVECEPGSGFHNPAPELFHFAAVDESGRSVADGTPGKLTLTHLDRTGTVLLRYVLGDVVSFTNSRCEVCGRSGGRVIDHHRREGNLTKIRGQMVDLRALQESVSNVPGLAEYSISIQKIDNDPIGMDEIVVRIAPERSTQSIDVVAAVTDSVSQAVHVKPRVQVDDLDAIYSVDDRLKPVRLQDNRLKEKTGSVANDKK